MRSSSTIPPSSRVELYADAIVPTKYGKIRTVVFREANGTAGGSDPREHVALVYGEVAGRENVLARVHSECWTGEVLHSLKCDCREQLDLALRRIVSAGAGVVLYLRQEGRGIGLGNKIRAYALQARGLDTVEANRSLGFEDDGREYGVAAAMLEKLDVRSIALLTNNPAKVSGLQKDGVEVTRRVPVLVTANEFNASYLATKHARMGHIIPLESLDSSKGAARPDDDIEQGDSPIVVLRPKRGAAHLGTRRPTRARAKK